MFHGLCELYLIFKKKKKKKNEGSQKLSYS